SRGSLTEPVATVRWPTSVGLSGVAVAVAALALAGPSGARSGPGPASARPLSGTPAMKQAQAAGIDIGAVIETVRHHFDPVPGTPAPDIQEKPSVAFDGTNYLVVWQDRRGDAYDIYGARVSQAGTVLDPAGIAIATGALGQFTPSVAFDGTNYLVVWVGCVGCSPRTISGARVNKAGVVLDPAGIAISTAAVSEFAAPSVTFDGSNYLV